MRQGRPLKMSSRPRGRSRRHGAGDTRAWALDEREASRKPNNQKERRWRLSDLAAEGAGSSSRRPVAGARGRFPSERKVCIQFSSRSPDLRSPASACSWRWRRSWGWGSSAVSCGARGCRSQGQMQQSPACWVAWRGPSCSGSSSTSAQTRGRRCCSRVVASVGSADSREACWRRPS